MSEREKMILELREWAAILRSPEFDLLELPAEAFASRLDLAADLLDNRPESE